MAPIHFTVPSLFVEFGSFFSRVFAFCRNQFERHHVGFLFGLCYIAVRIGIYVSSSLFSSLYRVAVLTTHAVSSTGSASDGLSALSYFGLVNSIFPVEETFVFMGTVLTVRSAVWFYAFIRAVYKNIPLKAS